MSVITPCLFCFSFPLLLLFTSSPWFTPFSFPLSLELLFGLSLVFACRPFGSGQRPDLRPQCSRSLPPARCRPRPHLLPLDVWPVGGGLGCHWRQTLLGMLCGAWILLGEGERKPLVWKNSKSNVCNQNLPDCVGLLVHLNCRWVLGRRLSYKSGSISLRTCRAHGNQI